MKKLKPYVESDIRRARQSMLDSIIDELIETHQQKSHHPVDRVVAIQLAGDLETLRHLKFDADWRARQASRLRDMHLSKHNDNE